MKDFFRIFFAVFIAGLLLIVSERQLRRQDEATAARVTLHAKLKEDMHRQIEQVSSMLDLAARNNITERHAARERLAPLVQLLTDQIAMDPEIYSVEQRGDVLTLSQKLNAL